MNLNLLHDPAFPCLLRDGQRVWLPLHAIAHPDVIDFAYPRADLNFSAKVFAIAVLQTVFAPANANEWLALVASPPDQDTLQSALNAAAHAFALDGDGPRFMQDRDELADGASDNMEGLLFDMPGAQTIKQNLDVFNKRDQVRMMSLPMAAMALFCFQSQAPAGGAGYRTGLRGGGPMSTLVQPRTPQTLWQRLWWNVFHREYPGFSYPDPDLHSGAVFPWLVPTRESKAKNSEIYPEDVHPLTKYWAMPWRLRLAFGEYDGVCDVSGESIEYAATGLRKKNYGNNYSGNWVPHPITPYRHQKTGDPYSVKAKSEGIHYKLWNILTFADDDLKEGHQPALVVPYAQALQKASRGKQRADQLHAFSYHLDKAKTIGLHEGYLPLYAIPEAKKLGFLKDVNALQLVVNTMQMELRKRLRLALNGVDGGYVDALFLQRSEAAFYHAIGAMVEQADCRLDHATAQAWLGEMRRIIFAMFDELVLASATITADRARQREHLHRWWRIDKKLNEFRKEYVKEHADA